MQAAPTAQRLSVPQRAAARQSAGSCSAARRSGRGAALRVSAAATLMPSAGAKPVRVCRRRSRVPGKALGADSELPLPSQLTKDEGLELYKDMYLGRAFEDMCAQVRKGRPTRRDGPPRATR